MTFSVIGAGFGRTGTKSIKQALEQLGIGPCHHMDELMGNPSQLSHWELAAKGQTVNWNDVFEGYRSAIDWPSAHYWRELADFYPEKSKGSAEYSTIRTMVDQFYSNHHAFA